MTHSTTAYYTMSRFHKQNNPRGRVLLGGINVVLAIKRAVVVINTF